jgi:hypothetical protein
MTILIDQDRFDVWADIMRLVSADKETVSTTKTDLRAAVNAVDDWVNTNASGLNTAIPQPARSALSSTQKARLLMLVIQKRFIKGA